jgi:hypothetical protein
MGQTEIALEEIANSKRKVREKHVSIEDAEVGYPLPTTQLWCGAKPGPFAPGFAPHVQLELKSTVS